LLANPRIENDVFMMAPFRAMTFKTGGTAPPPGRAPAQFWFPQRRGAGAHGSAALPVPGRLKSD